jgi:hypothetical protein
MTEYTEQELRELARKYGLCSNSSAKSLYLAIAAIQDDRRPELVIPYLEYNKKCSASYADKMGIVFPLDESAKERIEQPSIFRL